MRLRLLGGLLFFVVATHASIAAADDATPPTRQELLDPEWIETSLGEVGIDRLIKLYDDQNDPLLQLVQDALALSRAFLREHPDEFRSQMQARLMWSDEPELQPFQELPADRVRARSMRLSLNQAGDALIRSFPITGQGSTFVATSDGALIAVRAVRQERIGFNIHGIELRSGVSGELLQFFPVGVPDCFPVGISPDQSKAFCITEEGRLLAWEISTGAVLWNAACRFSSSTWIGCAFSPDGSLIAVTKRLPQIAVFEVDSGRKVDVIQSPGECHVGDVAFLDNDTLVGCCDDGVLRHWSVSSGEVIAEFEIDCSRLTANGTSAVSFESKIVEERSETVGFNVVDAVTGELIQHVDLEEGVHLRACDFDVDGEHVILSCYRPDRRLLAFAVDTGELTSNIPLTMNEALHFVPVADDRILTSGMEYFIQEWDLNRTGFADLASGRTDQVAITSDGSIAMTTRRGTIRLWDTSTWQETASFTNPEQQRSVVMSGDGQRLLYHYRHEVHAIDVATGQSTLVIKLDLEESEYIQAIGLSGDGRVGVASVERGKAFIFDVDDGTLLASTEEDRAISVSDDGSRILLGDRLLDLDTAEETRFGNAIFRQNALSGDGRLGMAYGSRAGNILWDLESHEILKGAFLSLESSWNSSPYLRIAITGNGRFSVSCDNEFNVYLYDTRDREQLTVVSAEGSSIQSIAISSDGRHLLIATLHGTWHHYEFENLPP